MLPGNNLEKRSRRNLITEPWFQFRYVLYFFLLGVFAALEVQWIIFDRIRDSIAAFYAQGKDAREVLAWLDPSMVTIGWPLLSFIAAYGVFCVFFGLYVSSRIAGPKFAIKRHISEMRRGNYGMRLFLRSTDELKDIATELNALSAKLQALEKKQSTGPTPTQARHSKDDSVRKAS